MDSCPFYRRGHVFFFVAGCGGDDGGYEGVGRLVAERNRARFAQSGNQQSSQVPDKSSSPTSTGAKSSEEVVVEEDVNVVSASSGKVLARGMAYLDGNGKIITIRIEKN